MRSSTGAIEKPLFRTINYHQIKGLYDTFYTIIFQAETSTSIDRVAESNQTVQQIQNQNQAITTPAAHLHLPTTTSLCTTTVSSQPTSVISAVGTVPVSCYYNTFLFF